MLKVMADYNNNNNKSYNSKTYNYRNGEKRELVGRHNLRQAKYIGAFTVAKKVKHTLCWGPFLDALCGWI